jgi:predicted metal-dependent peptidase
MTPLQEKVADKFKERKATKKYDEAVRHLLRTNPTLGVILLERLRPLVSYDCDCYYTNGVVIGYNPEAVLSMSILNNVFVIAHEIMHNLMCHSTRRSGRDPRLWNIAGDYCINSLLEKLKVGEIPRNEDGTPNCLLDDRYDGSKLSTEAVYNMLSSKVKPEEAPKKKPKGGSKDEPETVPQEGSKQGTQPEKVEDLIGKQFKEEIEKTKMGLVEDYVPDDENTWEPRGPSDHNEPHKELPSSAQELEDMYTEARIHGEFAGEKQSGDGGFDWEEIIALNTEEILSWEDALREYLTIKSKTKKNWMKPSNKWLQHGFWMPSKGGKSLDDIVIMIDESGSMGEDEIQAVFTNISELFEGGDVPLCKVAIIHFSGYDDIPDEHIEIVHEGDMPEYSRRTNGGTDFEGAFKKAVQLEERGMIQPSCYIMMTDMEDYYPEEPDYPVLWMSTQSFEQVSEWPGIPQYGKFTQLMI